MLAETFRRSLPGVIGGEHSCMDLINSNNRRQASFKTARRQFLKYCASLMLAVSSVSLVSAQVIGDWTRRLLWEPDLPIPRRLQAGDERVLFTRSLDLVYPEESLTWQDVIERATKSADLVVVVDVESVTGILAERDTWIATALKGKVRQVLWSSGAAKVKRGERLAFYVSDGEMFIDGVIVRALERSNKDIPHLPANSRYLLFIRRFDDAFYGTHDPLILIGDTLHYASPLEVPGQPVSPLEGRRLKAVEQIIHRVTAK